MRLVTYKDEKGYLRQAWVNDEVEDPTQGIPKMTIDINSLDWDAIKRDLHNALVERELYTWADVQRQQNSLSSIVKLIIVRPLIGLFRQEELENG